MKKWIGIAVVFAGCVMSATDLGRMFHGMAYGWDCILGGFILSVLAWIFLLDSSHGLLWDAAKSAVCIAVIVALLPLDGNETPAANNRKNMQGSGSQSWEMPAYPYVPKEKESMTCWSCYGDGVCDWCDGSGRYDHYPDWAGTICRTCDGTGDCPGCDGRGTYN